MDGLTLDQFTVFATIVDEGSFSSAAKRLGRSQSAVTYIVQKLEQQTGDIALFDRSAYRPTLTPAGHVLLPIARAVLRSVGRYRAQTADMARGIESEIRIVADLLAPLDRLIAALRLFEEKFPRVGIRLTTDFHDKIARVATEKLADLTILGEIPAKMLGLEHYLFDEIEFVVVAAPSHPLAQHVGAIELDTMAAYLQLVMDSRENLLGSREFGVVSDRRWYLSDLGNKLDLMLAGIGWGSMPRHSVASMLSDHRLVELTVTRWDGSDRMPHMSIAIGHHPDNPPGPAGRWLIDFLCNAHGGTRDNPGQIGAPR